MDLVIEWGIRMKLQLMKRTKDELKDLAKVYGIKGISKLNKEALCDEIMPVIIEEAVNQVAQFNEEQLECAKKLMSADMQCDDEVETYEFLQKIGHVIISKDGVVTLSDEMKDEYKKYFTGNTTVNTAVVENDLNMDDAKLHKYTLSAIHLYGIVSVEQFKALYEKYEEEQLDINAYIAWLNTHTTTEKPYKYVDGYVVAECLCIFEMAGFKDLLKNTEGKEYYVPSKEEFMRYSDENYYVHTLHIERLKTHLKTVYKLEDKKAEEAVFDLCLGQQITTRSGGHTLQHTLTNWSDMGVTPRTKEEVNKLVSFMIKVMNSTRVWLQRGFTIDEVNGIVDAQVNKVKVGRNENCPCGSGKKYKKCCGK